MCRAEAVHVVDCVLLLLRLALPLLHLSPVRFELLVVLLVVLLLIVITLLLLVVLVFYRRAGGRHRLPFLQV